MANPKEELRAEMRRRLEAVPRRQVQAHSRRVRERLRDLKPMRAARCFGLFAAMPGEIDLAELARQLLREGRQVAYPRYQAQSQSYEMVFVQDRDEELVVGKYGVPEPAPYLPAATGEQRRELLWFVPGLAFDAAGRRLGRGKGFYDRLLMDCVFLRKIGVCHDWQVVAQVPAAPHDIQMGYLVTERREWRCQAEIPSR